MDYQKESFLKHTGNDVQLFVSLAGGKQQNCNLYPGLLSLFEHLKTFYHYLFLLTECEWLAIAEYLSQYHHFSKQYDIKKKKKKHRRKNISGFLWAPGFHMASWKGDDAVDWTQVKGLRSETFNPLISQKHKIQHSLPVYILGD